MIRRRLTLAALLVALFTAGWAAGRGHAAGRFYGHFDLMIEVLQQVRANYVDPVEPQKLIDGALKGMLRELDPHSQYLSASAYEGLKGTLEGAFDGIGAYVDIRDGYPVVIAPIEGSPAWESGLLPGDVIVKVDDRPTWGLGLDELADRLRGEPGSKVTLSLSREGEADVHELTLERRHLLTPSVPYAFLAAPGVGYVRLASFSDKAGREVRAAVDSLRAAGAHALVLDLRGNPGGLVQGAVEVAGQFLPKGALVTYTKGRITEVDQRYTADAARPVTDWPVAVLVDGGSASASEIVAGALQDLDRAVVLGEVSFGKGSVQNLYPLHGANGAVKLTTALYYTPSGRSINRGTLGSSASTDDADDESDDETQNPHAAAPDSAPRPQFRTPSGRVVLGGGGVTPDVVVRPDSLPAVSEQIETHRLAFRFAERWHREHPASGAAVTPEVLKGFRTWLAGEKRVVDAETFAREAVPIERLLARELARRINGERAAAQVAASSDPVIQRALRILERAKSPRGVFALATAGRP